MLEHAAHALVNFGSLQRHLTQANVIERFDTLAPGVNLRFVDIASGGGIGEKQRQRQPLIDMASRFRVGVDDLFCPVYD